MKRNLKTIIYSLSMVFAVLFTVGCDKEESPFEGHDNHLVSFSITLADGVKYVAAIQGTDIVLTVPSGVTLSGAKAEYVLCENATIVPDPALITEWEDEQLFRVEAYNSSYVSYKYKVNRADIVEDGSITLSTQAEVSAFAEKGATVIGGNLIIGSAIESSVAYDTIKNVDALAGLQEVGMNIIVNSTYKGNNLNGLSNIKSIGGLYIGNKNKQAVLLPDFSVSFPVLEKAGTIVLVSDSIDVVSLPKLKTVSNDLYINSRKVKELDLASLTSCSGNLNVRGLSFGETSASESSTNQELKTLSFPVLEKIGGDLYIDNFWQVESLDLQKLSKVEGAMTLSLIRIVEQISLPALVHVGGAMTIQSNDGMTAFSAPLLKETASFILSSLNIYSINLKSVNIPALETVRGNLTIRYAAAENIEMAALKSVSGILNADNMLFLETFTLPAIEECGSITLNNITNLKTFDIGNVQKVQNITLTGCPNMELFKSPKVATGNVTITNSSSTILKLPEIAGLDTIRGTLRITAGNFTELVLPNVKRIGTFSHTSGSYLTSLIIPEADSIGSFTLSNLSKLTYFSAPKLKKTYSFSMRGLVLLENIELPALESVETTFVFYGGSYSSQASRSLITNLNAFASLGSVGNVDVRYCGNLVDFTGLKNVIEHFAVSNWTVTGNKYNPTYQDMVDGKYIQ